MSYISHYNRGNWAVICDVCGRKMRADRLRLRWDGLMTCELDWEPRQPQDFVRGVADYQAPQFTRPEQTDQFIQDYAINKLVNGYEPNTYTLG